MRKNPKLPMLTSMRRKTWTPHLFQGCPKWQRAVQRVTILGDLQERSFAELDYLFAIFASNGSVSFSIYCSGQKLRRWLESVSRRSAGAAEKYERRMKAHFKKHGRVFVAGYQPPTPELRVIYDSSARNEGGETNAGDYWHGFSGQEYHWRHWPLTNVEIRENLA